MAPAAAAEGPDESGVAALARAAARAERAGGHVAAAAAYERAADLTNSDAPRARRLFAAASDFWAAGHPERARKLAEAAKVLADERLLRADIDRLRARIEINIGSAETAHHIFISAARSVAADDPIRALEMRVAATLTHLHNAEIIHISEITNESVDVSAASNVDETPSMTARNRCLQRLLEATTADAAGRWAPALTALRAALAVAGDVDDADVLGNLGNAALHLGDDDGHRRCFTRMLAGARDRGAVMSVVYALPRLAFADLVAGQWSRVRDAASEALTLSEATGQRPPRGSTPRLAHGARCPARGRSV